VHIVVVTSTIALRMGAFACPVASGGQWPGHRVRLFEQASSRIASDLRAEIDGLELRTDHSNLFGAVRLVLVFLSDRGTRSL